MALEHGIQQIKDPRLKSALRTVLTTAEDMDDAKRKLENWFNDGMSRASEHFKKWIQRWSLAVALTLTVVLNVDTLYLARTLWEDPQLRQNVVQAATVFETEGIPLNESDEDANLVPEDEANEGTTFADITEDALAAQETAQTLLELQLPITWEITPVTDEMIQQSLNLGLPDPRSNPRNLWNYDPRNNGNWFTLLLEKLIGIGLTTIAAAQGAPFWFDLLRKLTSRD